MIYLTVRLICGAPVPPPTKDCHYPHSFRSSFGYFPKNINKNALDIINLLLTDESITIDIVPQLNFS